MAAPWLRDAWLRLVTAFESNRLAHAYYLKHCPDKGSNSFIEQFTEFSKPTFRHGLAALVEKSFVFRIGFWILQFG